MLIPRDKMHEWANSVEPTAQMYIKQFLAEVEARMKAEVDAAKMCLKNYGYKVYEDQHHEYHEM